MNDYTEIQCPVCSGKIFIDTKQLLQGGSFSCTNPSCDASVSLSSSSYEVAHNAFNDFEKLKGKLIE